MALRKQFTVKHNGITLQSGYVYEFNYTAFENDPKPLYLHLYAIKGTHPTSGKQWNLIQGINLNYIPRSDRIRFAERWVSHLERTRNVKLTWNLIVREFPYIKFGIRRYLLTPRYYIRNIKQIKRENLYKAIKGSFFKDFSKYLKKKLVNLKKGLMGTRKKPKPRIKY